MRCEKPQDGSNYSTAQEIRNYWKSGYHFLNSMKNSRFHSGEKKFLEFFFIVTENSISFYIVHRRYKVFLSLFAYSRNQLRLIKRQKKLTMTAISVTSRSNYHSKGFFSSLLWVDKKFYRRRGKKLFHFSLNWKIVKIKLPTFLKKIDIYYPIVF